MSTDLLKSFGAELLAALAARAPGDRRASGPNSQERRQRNAQRNAQRGRRTGGRTDTLRDSGDLAGAEETLLAVAGARARAAETLSTRELYTVIRASAGLAEVSVARDDWAAAEDAVKLALAASEALAPEWRTAN